MRRNRTIYSQVCANFRNLREDEDKRVCPSKITQEKNLLLITILPQVYRVRSNNLFLRTDIEPTRNSWILKYKIHLIENNK